MSVLDQYLERQAALVAAYNQTPAGAYQLVQEWPSADMAWNPATKVFAWWWAGDEGPHSFQISRIEDDDYQAVLFHEHGKIEVGPVWNGDQQRLLDAWVKERDAANIGEWLARVSQPEAASAGPAPAAGPLRSFQVMLEQEQVPYADPLTWVTVGAWAADEGEIAFWALPEFAAQGDEKAASISQALARGFRPLEILDYWYQAAYAPAILRPKLEPITAANAAAAAELAARQAGV